MSYMIYILIIISCVDFALERQNIHTNSVSHKAFSRQNSADLYILDDHFTESEQVIFMSVLVNVYDNFA